MEIILLILIVINWLIYHHIFRVYYFGNAGQSILKEIFGCSLVAVIELAIIMTVGGWILGALLVIGVIVLVIYAVYKIYKFVKGKSGETPKRETEEEVEQETMKDGMDVHKAETAERGFCANCGKPISKDARFCMFCGANNMNTEDRGDGCI